MKTEELSLVAGGEGDIDPGKGNNGLGNGDQTAPGGSDPNNGADDPGTGNLPGRGKWPAEPN